MKKNKLSRKLWHQYLLPPLVIGLSVWFWLSLDDTIENPKHQSGYPPIYPDYCGVTIPCNIAPMNFSLKGEWKKVDVQVEGGRSGSLHVRGKQVIFNRAKWQTLLAENVGDTIHFTVCIKDKEGWTQYDAFPMAVTADSIPYGVAYRKIAPGYEVYSHMGIYERTLADYHERPLLENTQVPGMCLNCHTLHRTDPSKLSLHIRGKHGATLMQRDGEHELLNTKTDSTLSACVYPYWHPSGEYIAYSVNNTRQSFHTVREERIEVFDLASDVVIYHPATHRLLRSPLLQRSESFETFPVFSADGSKLYFCSSKAQEIPSGYQDIHYDLCSIDFNPATGEFGQQVDTLLKVSTQGKSISFPRPSYDGRYLVYTLSNYGNFSIWHKEADLWLLDLEQGTTRPLSEVNSDDTESFHNWSADSRWMVFSSRRHGGLYTRLYFTHIDAQGHFSKPFLMPQKSPWEYEDENIYSYNVPDFTSAPIQLDRRDLEKE
ncbi:MAG: TolB family protein, partial [Bacteroides sp.]